MRIVLALSLAIAACDPGGYDGPTCADAVEEVLECETYATDFVMAGRPVECEADAHGDVCNKWYDQAETLGRCIDSRADLVFSGQFDACGGGDDSECLARYEQEQMAATEMLDAQCLFGGAACEAQREACGL